MWDLIAGSYLLVVSDINFPSQNLITSALFNWLENRLGLKPANLPSVCKALKIPLSHHDALSDAVACAKIAIAVFGKKTQ